MLRHPGCEGLSAVRSHKTRCSPRTATWLSNRPAAWIFVLSKNCFSRAGILCVVGARESRERVAIQEWKQKKIKIQTQKPKRWLLLHGNDSPSGNSRGKFMAPIIAIMCSLPRHQPALHTWKTMKSMQFNRIFVLSESLESRGLFFRPNNKQRFEVRSERAREKQTPSFKS